MRFSAKRSGLFFTREIRPWGWCVGLLGVIAFAVLCALLDAGEPSTDHLGQRISDASLKGNEGQSVVLSDFRGKRGTAIVFLSFDCPVTTSSCSELAALSRAYPEIGFLGLTCETADNPSETAKRAKEFGLPFPVLNDSQQTVVNALKARITPEAFLLDAGFVLRYRGRINDRYAKRLIKNVQPSSNDLRQAVDELLAGKPVGLPATEAVGCPIVRDQPPVVARSNVVFSRDVLPILQRRCEVCHRPGSVGPFTLSNYKQAVNWANDIREFTANRTMPPWKVTEGVPFTNDRRLSKKEIDLLAAWVRNGAPEGPAHAEPVIEHPGSIGELGTPDLVLSPEADFELGPSGDDIFRTFLLPTSLAEDAMLRAVEIAPGNAKIVEQAFVTVKPAAKDLGESTARVSSEGDRGPGNTVSMAPAPEAPAWVIGWYPGCTPLRLPGDTGYNLSKGATLQLTVHYRRTGRLEKDRTQVRLYTGGGATRSVQGLVLEGSIHTISPEESHYRIAATARVAQDCVLYALLPHMHHLGHRIKLTYTPPTGRPRVLLRIDDWDFHWQEEYVLASPLTLKEGARLDLEAMYDNSSANPHSLSRPPRLVTYGSGSEDEMCRVFLLAAPEQPGRLKALQPLP